MLHGDLEAGGDCVRLGEGQHVDLFLAGWRQLDTNPGPAAIRTRALSLPVTSSLAAGVVSVGSDAMDLDGRHVHVHRRDASDRHHVEGRRAKPGVGDHRAR